MNKNMVRIPRQFDGTHVTTHHVSRLLVGALAKLSCSSENNPQAVVDAWPEIIGSQLARMTQAVSLYDGILTVKVRNSTLHSLLSRHEKNRILCAFKQRFPNNKIQNIVFRIG